MEVAVPTLPRFTLAHLRDELVLRLEDGFRLDAHDERLRHEHAQQLRQLVQLHNIYYYNLYYSNQIQNKLYCFSNSVETVFLSS